MTGVQWDDNGKKYIVLTTTRQEFDAFELLYSSFIIDSLGSILVENEIYYIEQ